MKRSGVTIVELLVVMGIFVIISAAILPMLSLYEGRQAVRSVSIQVEQMAKKAQTRSLAGTLGQAWGIYVPGSGNVIVLFAGDEYHEIGNVDVQNIGSVTQTQETFQLPRDVRVCMDMDDDTVEDNDGRILVFPTSAQNNTRTYLEIYANDEQRFVLVETSGAITMAETNGESCQPTE